MLNFIIDFILLFLLKLVNRKRSKILRLAGAAVTGGIVSVFLSLLPLMSHRINALHTVLWMDIVSIILKVTSLVLMLMIAFGKLKWMDLLKQVISFYLITYFVGGLMNSIYYHTNIRLYLLNMGNVLVLSNISWKYVIIVLLCLLPCVLALLWLQRLYKRGARETYDVELFMEERCVKTKGLFDTGNCLYDPVYNNPVMVVERSIIEELLSKEYLCELEKVKHYLENAKNSDETATATEQSDISKNLMLRLRFIPYRSIGKPRGLMCGLKLDKVLIHTEKEIICSEKVTAAIYDYKLSPKEEYHIILHKELL
jgi:stage II sporulation protein GA (sporulation sigma-E factor processing peptidase)